MDEETIDFIWWMGEELWLMIVLLIIYLRYHEYIAGAMNF